ncbi:flagellar motor switch protein FliN [Helicobacter enhydrae]|uniref:Flagellar motor switch protein FliN n=1 Tax=Helicobacter enhydrae TaxID=222136 RepID=A0A1B1U4D9_9HELI|nr:flagellar motor switch protein FliY [Helicobacter enhydrae]ANV97616.1 flagellar motor switch protein FliN [Helicobacter enhydrae]
MLAETFKALTALFVQESTATLEGLLGIKPEMSYKDVVLLENSNMEFPYILISGKCRSEGMQDADIAMIFPAPLATALSSLMLGGDGESTEEITPDDVDAIKEISNNILGAVSTALTADKTLPSMSFEILDAQIITQGQDLSQYIRAWHYDIQINNIQSYIINLASVEFVDHFNRLFGESQPAQQAQEDSSHTSQVTLEELKNISMLLDIKLSLHVRIGQKRMLLKDVIAMDIGSVVELNQLANESLEVLVDDKPIARGEVVIVDGNFGVQITEIGTRKERLEQIKVR